MRINQTLSVLDTNLVEPLIDVKIWISTNHGAPFVEEIVAYRFFKFRSFYYRKYKMKIGMN